MDDFSFFSDEHKEGLHRSMMEARRAIIALAEVLRGTAMTLTREQEDAYVDLAQGCAKLITVRCVLNAYDKTGVLLLDEAMMTEYLVAFREAFDTYIEKFPNDGFHYIH
jgi:hypothetical protein